MKKLIAKQDKQRTANSAYILLGVESLISK
jgi:hypothetical protein